MKILLVSRDAAPSACFAKLDQALRDAGLETVLRIGGGKPLKESLEEIRGDATRVDFVLLGMSFPGDNAVEEVAAGESARNAGIPYGFYGDKPNCWAREPFQELAQDASLYLGPNQEDALAAKARFPKARLVGSGNPLREDMAFPRYTRKEVRERLGIKENEKCILVPGGKCVAGNMAMCLAVIDAVGGFDLFHQEDVRIFFSTHPGDRAVGAVDADGKPLDLYGEIRELSKVPFEIVRKETMTTSEMVPGADVIVEFGSSVGFEGAYQRIPVLTPLLEILMERNRRLDNNEDIPEAVREGISAGISPKNLSSYLKMGSNPCRKEQERICPSPRVRGAAIATMVEEIRSLLA